MTDLAQDVAVPQPSAAPPSTDEQWILNPEIVWRALSVPAREQFELAVPVPGEGLKVAILSAEARQRLLATLARVLDGHQRLRPDVSAATAAALRRAGVIVAAANVPKAVRFRCELTPLLWDPHADPSACAGVRITPPGDAGSLSLASGNFAAEPHFGLAWIADPARGVDWPFWISGPATPLDMRLPPEISRPTDDRVRTWEDRLNQARRTLAASGFAVLREFVPGAFLASAQDYYHRLVANGFLIRGDRQALRYNRHNEPLACWLHRHTLPLIQRVVSEKITSSYSYLGFYLGGAALARHTDRAQCQYTLSLAVDAQPSARAEDAWPLCLDLADGSTAQVLLAPGDAVIFRGTELPHYRARLPEGRTSWSMFLHYVPEGFAGTLD